MDKSTPWRDNANSFLVLYSILAAVCAVMITLVFQSGGNSNLSQHWYIPIPMLMLALGAFIFSAEALTDALDENDVKKYLSTLLLYNVAVLLLISGVLSSIYFQYVAIKLRLLIPSAMLRLVALAIVDVGVTWHWIYDIWWLLTKPKDTLLSYIEELCGTTSSTIERKKFGWSYLFLGIKGLRKDEAIFASTIIEMKPSNVDGVGVFAAKDIRAGEVIAEGIHKEDYKTLIPWSATQSFDNDTKARIASYCIGTPEGFFPPPENDFNQLSVEWYMNHACDGNIGFNDKGDFVAIKQIAKGDELTYDYGLAESNPAFVMTCACGSPGCRKMVTGNDWKDMAFRSTHLSYMLPRLRNQDH